LSFVDALRLDAGAESGFGVAPVGDPASNAADIEAGREEGSGQLSVRVYETELRAASEEESSPWRWMRCR